MIDAGRVLIADDDDAIRNLVSRILELEGLPYDAVRDGRAAIECLQKREYAVLLIDLMMPVMSGYEVLAYMKANPRPGTVLVMTAVADTDLRRLDGEVVTTVVRKPFDIQRLAILVRDAALRFAEERQNRRDDDNVLPFPGTASSENP